MGRFEDAVASFRRAIDLKPNFPEAYNNLGGALKETGEFGQAIAAFNKALELRPGYISATWKSVRRYHCKGQARQGTTHLPGGGRLCSAAFRAPTCPGQHFN